MGRAFPAISAKVCIRALERAGFRVVAQKGSHVKLRSEETGRRCVVPMHPELATGTLASISARPGSVLTSFSITWTPGGHASRPVAEDVASQPRSGNGGHLRDDLVVEGA
jgi:predicted RNA binding protein YcfA (HicA-like mRNA interferase family)